MQKISVLSLEQADELRAVNAELLRRIDTDREWKQQMYALSLLCIYLFFCCFFFLSKFSNLSHSSFGALIYNSSTARKPFTRQTTSRESLASLLSRHTHTPTE
jgi:hypothetical protein